MFHIYRVSREQLHIFTTIAAEKSCKDFLTHPVLRFQVLYVLLLLEVLSICIQRGYDDNWTRLLGHTVVIYLPALLGCTVIVQTELNNGLACSRSKGVGL